MKRKRIISWPNSIEIDILMASKASRERRVVIIKTRESGDRKSYFTKNTA